MKHSFQDILYMDTETVALYPTYKQLPDIQKHLWDIKATKYIKNPDLNSIEKLYITKAGIHAEFSKVVCISLGYISNKGLQKLKVKSIISKNEIEILNEFKTLIDDYYKSRKHQAICGHNIKEFDIPFLSRRFLINGISIPSFINVQNKKPWEVNHFVDTLELWKFGDFKHYISLELLAETLGVHNSKPDMNGSKVHDVFYKEDNLVKIQTYCENDILTVAKVHQRLLNVTNFKISNDLVLEH